MTFDSGLRLWLNCKDSWHISHIASDFRAPPEAQKTLNCFLKKSWLYLQKTFLCFALCVQSRINLLCLEESDDINVTHDCSCFLNRCLTLSQSQVCRDWSWVLSSDMSYIVVDCVIVDCNTGFNESMELHLDAVSFIFYLYPCSWCSYQGRLTLIAQVGIQYLVEGHG